MKMASLSACVALTMAASTASALQYTGVISGGEGMGQIDLSGFPDSTNYKFTFSTSAPIVVGNATYVYEAAFDQYFDGSPTPYGGDNEPVEEPFNFSSSPASTVFTTPADYNLYYPDGNLMERDYFYSDYVAVDFHVPDGYDGTSFTFDVTPVPEPASWSLLILGFAGLGSVLRRRPKSAALN